MKTDDVRRNSAATTRRGRRADFLFVGLGVLPLILMLGGQPGIAFLLFSPLLFAACLCGMWEQVEFQGAPCHRSADSRERRSASTLTAAGATLREHGEAGDRPDGKLPARGGDMSGR
jgi:hypothetical protein